MSMVGFDVPKYDYCCLAPMSNNIVQFKSLIDVGRRTIIVKCRI